MYFSYQTFFFFTTSILKTSAIYYTCDSYIDCAPNVPHTCEKYTIEIAVSGTSQIQFKIPLKCDQIKPCN